MIDKIYLIYGMKRTDGSFEEHDKFSLDLPREETAKLNKFLWKSSQYSYPLIFTWRFRTDS